MVLPKNQMRRTLAIDTILVDTGYWIALFDPREEWHELVVASADLLENLTLVVPWPNLYETLRTRFVRHPDWVVRLDDLLKKPNVEFIDDSSYCEDAYSLAVDHSIRLRRPISMVDMLCRLLIDDPNVRIDYVATTNPRDFQDICISKGVEFLL
jgi:predicted nucleic acid-binding protein